MVGQFTVGKSLLAYLMPKSLLLLFYSLRVFQTSINWSLSDSKFPQVSRTLLSILANLNNIVPCMVLIHPPISTSSSPLSKCASYIWYHHNSLLSKFLRWSSMIFIIKGFQTIVFNFIIISITFRLICPPAFYRYLSNLGTFMEIFILTKDLWQLTW